MFATITFRGCQELISLNILTTSGILLDECKWSDTHQTLEDTVKIREVVIACKVGHFLDGMMAGEEEHLSMHDTTAHDIVGRSETGVEAKEPDEAVLGEACLCRQFVKGRYFGKVTVDSPDGLADTDVTDRSGRRILVHKTGQKDMEKTIEFEAGSCRKRVETLYAGLYLEGGFVTHWVEVIEAKSWDKAEQMGEELLIPRGRRGFQCVGIPMEMVEYLHRKVGEVNIAKVYHAFTLYRMGQQGGNKIKLPWGEGMFFMTETGTAMPLTDKEDA